MMNGHYFTPFRGVLSKIGAKEFRPLPLFPKERERNWRKRSADVLFLPRPTSI